MNIYPYIEGKERISIYEIWDTKCQHSCTGTKSCKLMTYKLHRQDYKVNRASNMVPIIQLKCPNPADGHSGTTEAALC